MPAYAEALAHYDVALAWYKSVFGCDSYQQAVAAQTSPERLARAIVDRYAAPLSNRQDPYLYTLSILDLSAMQETALAMQPLSTGLLRYALTRGENRLALRRVRAGAQQLDSDGDEDVDNRDE